MITEIKVETYIKELRCDNCGKEMEREMIVLASCPPQFSYTCTCGHKETHEEIYPYTYYKTVQP